MKTAAQQTKQLSFSQAEYGSKKKLTRRDLFLAKMESVVPWARLIAVIEPYYPKSGKRGRPPVGLGRMLRRRRERPEREERRDEENEAHESGCGLPNHCTILPSHLARRRRRASSAT